MTSATQLVQDMRKNTFGYEHVVGRKEYIWTLTKFTVFWIIINLYKIMQDSKHRTITQPIHTNLISCFFLLRRLKFFQIS